MLVQMGWKKRVGVWAGILLAYAAIANGQPVGRANVRDALLKGVAMIDSGGAPGVILCAGSNAIPIMGAKCGKAVQSVAAACIYEKGRVVAVGHPSFYTAEGVSKADTARFVHNSIIWLGQGKPTVAVYKDSAVAQALGTLEGVSVREIPSLERLDDFNVLAVYPDNLELDEVERVRAFITSGGGLLASGIGWGWQQVTRGKSLATENHFNRLLEPAGLLINSDTAERTSPQGYQTRFPIPLSVNGTEAMRLAASGTLADVDALRQVSHTLCAIKSVLPPHETEFSRGLAALTATPSAAMLPAREKPLGFTNIAARLSLIAHQTEWRTNLLQNARAHPAAVTYPGLPPVDAQRETRTLFVKLDIPRWHSTGLFAGAGEPVTIELPPGAEKLGLRFRIGATTCDNTDHDTWRRAPKVDMEVPLNARKLTISSPFGGLLYVVVPEKPDSAERVIEVKLRNACPAPWFKPGRDSLEAWRSSIRHQPAPWAELESDKVILTIPSSEIRTLDDPATLLAFWDKIADQDAQLTGIPAKRRSAERFCADVQLCAGWMHAGYPIMIPDVTARDIVNLDRLKTKGDWGFFHELGHNHQNGDWTFNGTGEVTVNFFTLYNMEHACGIPPRQTRMGEENIQRAVRSWVEKGKSHDDWCRDPFLALETFVRIQQTYGWDAFERLFADYRTLKKADQPRSDAEKRDQWVVRLSRIADANIASIFDAWNIPVSEEARQACAKHPKPADPRLFDGL